MHGANQFAESCTEFDDKLRASVCCHAQGHTMQLLDRALILRSQVTSSGFICARGKVSHFGKLVDNY